MLPRLLTPLLAMPSPATTSNAIDDARRRRGLRRLRVRSMKTVPGQPQREGRFDEIVRRCTSLADAAQRATRSQRTGESGRPRRRTSAARKEIRVARLAGRAREKRPPVAAVPRAVLEERPIDRIARYARDDRRRRCSDSQLQPTRERTSELSHLLMSNSRRLAWPRSLSSCPHAAARLARAAPRRRTRFACASLHQAASASTLGVIVSGGGHAVRRAAAAGASARARDDPRDARVDTIGDRCRAPVDRWDRQGTSSARSTRSTG